MKYRCFTGTGMRLIPQSIEYQPIFAISREVWRTRPQMDKMQQFQFIDRHSRRSNKSAKLCFINTSADTDTLDLIDAQGFARVAISVETVRKRPFISGDAVRNG
jgi:hypothetical protein